MNANEMTFGVEIETHMPRGSVNPGSHRCGRQVDWLPAGWLADSDPSIIVPHDGRVKCEFVSPVLKGAEGLRQVCEVVAEIKRRGGQVNASCGTHVHVGYDKGNTPAVGRLISLVANHEKAMYAATGTRNREQGSGSRYRTCWCKSMKQYGNKAAARLAASRDRYHLLNLATVHSTVEFRVFGASLNPVKLAAYVRLCAALCEKSLVTKKAASFNTKAKGTRNRARFTGGEGHAELVRLFYAIGWRKNGAATKAVHGLIEGEGVPSMDAARKALARLATQYDAAPSV
jgi:Putative amidoligase enzyme